MAKSDYTYQIENYHGKKAIIIEDLDLGGMSVTNDIEYVVNEICQANNLDSTKCLIVYRDSDTIWTGWVSTGHMSGKYMYSDMISYHNILNKLNARNIIS